MNDIKYSFGKYKVTKNEKTLLVQKIFSEIANNYDLMNDLMSFGTHRIWKREFLNIVNIQEKEKIIDVGTGTGDLVKMIYKKRKGNLITSVDLNYEMLNYAKKSINSLNDINWINSNAENLPFKKNFFDKYMISFCLRNITLIQKAINESYRILKPGGSFYCLEFSKPESSLLNSIYKSYKKNIIPLIGDKITNNINAYKYLEESIGQFYDQDHLLEMINKSGFKNTSYVNLFNGIISIHIGHKI